MNWDRVADGMIYVPRHRAAVPVDQCSSRYVRPADVQPPAPCEGCATDGGRHVAPKRRADRPVDASALAVTTYGGRHRARVSA